MSHTFMIFLTPNRRPATHTAPPIAMPFTVTLNDDCHLPMIGFRVKEVSTEEEFWYGLLFYIDSHMCLLVLYYYVSFIFPLLSCFPASAPFPSQWPFVLSLFLSCVLIFSLLAHCCSSSPFHMLLFLLPWFSSF